LRSGNAAEPDGRSRQPQEQRRRRHARRLSLDAERALQRAISWGWLQMIDTVNSDVRTLKEWLRGAWRQLANPNLTRLEQRELRYYMKDVERALRTGLKQVADRDTARGGARHETPARKHPTFRLLQLNA
jgi:hypothetical protein